MFELTQTLWAVFLVAFPVGLFIGAGIMVWRAGGLPVNESMALFRAMVDVSQEQGARIKQIEERQDATDNHLRALGRDVEPVGRVVSLRGRR